MSDATPVLDDNGLLPLGMHDVTWEMVTELFGRIQRTTRRHELCDKLREYIDELRKAGLGDAIVIDGSFVMGSVDEPSDIDVVVLMPPGWEAEELRPVEEKLLGNAARRTYRVQVSALTKDSTAAVERVDFYRQVNTKWCERFGWPVGLKKGLLRMTL